LLEFIPRKPLSNTILLKHNNSLLLEFLILLNYVFNVEWTFFEHLQKALPSVMNGILERGEVESQRGF